MRHHTDEPTKLLEHIREDVDAFVGEAPQFDDLTMLALEIRNVKKYSFKASGEETAAASAFVEEALEAGGCPMKTAMKLMIIFDEIFSNIVNYSGADEVSVSVEIVDEEARLKFEDDGVEYNPLLKDDPDVTLNLDEREVGGLGIFMTKKLADTLDYQYKDGKNIVTITRKF